MVYKHGLIIIRCMVWLWRQLNSNVAVAYVAAALTLPSQKAN